VAQGWLRFSDPDFDFEFDYPLATDAGDVEISHGRHAGGRHVHLQTPDAKAVYFEVSFTEGRAGDEAILWLSRDVMARYEDAWFSPTRETSLCGVPGRYGWFRFADRVRWVITTVDPLPGYRVIVDPRSATNLQILGSMTIRPR
jgi:hypothetical protein